MPVIKSAKKKLRQDRKLTIARTSVENTVKLLIKKAKIAKTEEAVRLAVKATDKATKKHIMHKNKAARIKSQLATLVPKTTPKPKAKSPKK